MLFPNVWSYELFEIYLPRSSWNPSQEIKASTDYENYYGRKTYASNVTGAYYTARLVVCEYLEKIKKQAPCLVFREERPEYNAPLGVGILRELGRDAFLRQPEKFDTTEEAFKKMQERMKLSVSLFRQKSWLLKEYGKQTRLNGWV